jgi:hypothetical protein
MNGMHPDPCVWVALFLGRERQERLQQEFKEADGESEKVLGAHDSLRNAMSTKQQNFPSLTNTCLIDAVNVCIEPSVATMKSKLCYQP